MPSAAELRAALEEGHDAALEAEGALVAAYDGAIRALGRRAGRLFSRKAGNLVADADWTPPPLNEIVDQNDAASLAARRTAKPRAALLTAAVTPVLALVEETLDPRGEAAGALLEAVGPRAEQMAEGLREPVARIVGQAFEEGWSVTRTASAIVDASAEVAGWQAQALARTDLVTLENGGSLAAVRRVNAVSASAGEEGFTHKRWLSAGDGRVRPDHANAHGQTVPIDEAFAVGGAAMQYPGDPAGPPQEVWNCRCTLVYLEGADAATVAAVPPLPPVTLEAEMAEPNAALLELAESLKELAEAGLTVEQAEAVAEEAADLVAATVEIVAEEEQVFEEADLVGDLSVALANVSTLAQTARGYQWNAQGSDFNESRELFGAIYEDSYASLTELAAQIRQLGGQSPYSTADIARLRTVEDGGAYVSAADMTFALRQINERVLTALGAAFTAATAAGESGCANYLAERVDAHQRWAWQLRVSLAASAAVTIRVEGDGEAASEPRAGRGARWESELAFENWATEDGRYMMPDSLSWREPPLTLMAMVETTEGGHLGAQVAGRMDTFEKRRSDVGADVVAVYATGVFDDEDYGAMIERMVEDQMLTGISVDLAISDWAARDPETGEITAADDLTDDQWWGLMMGDLQFAVLQATILAATVCPTPAFAEAKISMTASGEKRMTLWAPLRLVRSDPPALVAAVAPLAPPRAWFEVPEADELTPLTVTEEGAVYGHVATYDCHRGFQGYCMTVPGTGTRSGFADFHLGQLETAEGDLINIGKITIGRGHADTGLTKAAAREHYDDVDCVAAFGRCYEGRLGTWFSGTLKSDITPERLRDFRANPPSGDWRGGELIALHSVVVPGLPVYRNEAHVALAADGSLDVLTLITPPVIAHEMDEEEFTAALERLGAEVEV